MKLGRQLTQDAVEAQLEEAGVSPTPQRVEIARIMLSQPQHMSAEDVLVALRKAGAAASKATVYNTLRLFAQCGLLRTVIVDPTKVFYDSNTTHHHRFYDVEAGTLTDFRAEEVHSRGFQIYLRVRPWMGWISPCECAQPGPENNGLLVVAKQDRHRLLSKIAVGA